MSDGNGSATRKTYGAKVAAGLTVVGAVARLIPHPANFTPVGGTSLYAGARLRGWSAYLVPLILMAVTDPILTAIYGYPLIGRITPIIYGSFLINVWIGKKLLATVNPRRVAAASTLCSLQFFVLTNLAVWMWGGLYALTLAGLITCFAAALPFLGRTMAGDLSYAGFFFALDAGLGRLKQSSKSEIPVPAESPAA